MSQPSVLIVEDEQILADLIKEELEKQGYATVSAADGQQGWDLAKIHKPDVILLDLLMPVMDGYAFLQLLRQDPELKGTPCIVVSNSGQMDDLNRAYEYGANDVLIKADFNPDQVVGKVRKALDSNAAKEKTAS
jgi:CheY-like chemotaxis protein